MKFLNTQTNQEEDFDNDNTKVALANPIYAPVGPATFRIKADDGTIYETTDLTKARAFVGEGHGSFLTDFDLEKEKWDKAGIAGDVAAVGLGALSGLTFGASDLAARALGKEETVKAIREASPAAAAAGEIGSLFVPGFGTAAAAAKAGKLAATGAVKVAGKLALSKGKAAALAKAGEAVARGSTLGAQQGITEVALSDVPLVSEAAGGMLAKDVLLGGALDLGFTLGAPVVRELAKKGWTYVPGSSTATDAVNKAYAKVASKVPFGAKDEGALLSMVRKEERQKIQNFQKDFEKNVENTTDSLKNLRDGYAKAAGDKLETARTTFKANVSSDPVTIDTIATGVPDLIKEASRVASDEVVSGTVRGNAKRFSVLLERLKKTADGVKAGGSSAKDVASVVDDLFEARTLVKDALRNTKEAAKRGELITKKFDLAESELLVTKTDDLFEKLGQTAEMRESDRLYAIKSDLAKFLRKVTNRETGKVNPEKVSKLLKRGKIGETPIEEFIARIQADEGVLSTALGPTAGGASRMMRQMADLAAMSRRYKAIQSATGQFTGRSLLPFVGGFGLGGVNPAGAALGAALTPLLNPEAYLRAVDAVENVVSKVAKATGPRPAGQQLANAQGLGQQVLNAVREAARSRKTMIVDEAALGVAEMLMQPKRYEEHYAQLTDGTGGNLEPHMQRFERMHPELPASAAAQYAAIQQYLASQAPLMRASYNRPGTVRVPTHAELQKYAQQVVAATDPWGVLQRAATKGRTPNTIQLQTIQTLYPSIYGKLVDVMPGPEIGGMADIQALHEAPPEEPGDEQRKAVKPNIKPAMTSIQRATMR